MSTLAPDELGSIVAREAFARAALMLKKRVTPWSAM